ncbi:MAG: UPF0280 family protein [Candidatus Jordarchaeaceae archaeon]
MKLTRIKYTIKQSRLTIETDNPPSIRDAIKSIKKNREELEAYILKNPEFLTSFEPLEVSRDAPKIVQNMANSAFEAGVGPMAAVAGALADLAVDAMLIKARVAVVENGGEISADSNTSIIVGILAGYSSLSGKIGFRLKPEDFPIGIGTSSGTISHAISFGEADAATVIADNAALADAAATAVGNAVQGEDFEQSVQRGLEIAETIRGVRGSLIIRGEYVGLVGKLPQLVKINGESWKKMGSIESYLPPKTKFL